MTKNSTIGLLDGQTTFGPKTQALVDGKGLSYYNRRCNLRTKNSTIGLLDGQTYFDLRDFTLQLRESENAIREWKSQVQKAKVTFEGIIESERRVRKWAKAQKPLWNAYRGEVEGVNSVEVITEYSGLGGGY